MLQKILLPAVLLLLSASASAAVTVLDKDQWRFSIGGYVELDTIFDTTRSFVEEPGNSPIDRPDSINALNGREQFSVRNSRLSFLVEPPEADGWRTRGYLELDLKGFDPAPGTNNTEASFYNNGTLRVRHAYMNAETGDWQFLAGQYWGLLGWQPYYFMPTLQVAPVPGMLYVRTAQLRLLRAFHPGGEDNLFQVMLGVMRPPQRDAALPGLEGGLRFALGSRTAAYTGGATGGHKQQPMSIGLSATAREFAIPSNPTAPTSDQTYYAGHGFAADLLLPVIASSDGKDLGHNFVIGSEFSTGTGYGDQFAGWTGNLPSPLSNVDPKAGAAVEKNVNLDAGIGGFDASNNFALVNLWSWNVYFQYHLPAACKTWLSGGYGRLSSDNIDTMTSMAIPGKTAANKVPYDRQEIVFANIAHDFTSQIRAGFEYAFEQTTYGDGVLSHNSRYQLNAWFIF